LEIKVERLINGLDLRRTFSKNVLSDIDSYDPLENGTICSSPEEMEDTVPLKEGVGGSSLEEHVSKTGAAASANNL
jgi:hypothetical protein